MTNEQRAEKLFRDICYGHADIVLRGDAPEQVKRIATALRQIREQALQEAAKVALEHSKGRQCPESYEGHDDRWCDKCEAYQDQAEFIWQKIKALALESEEGK